MTSIRSWRRNINCLARSCWCFRRRRAGSYQAGVTGLHEASIEPGGVIGTRSPINASLIAGNRAATAWRGSRNSGSGSKRADWDLAVSQDFPMRCRTGRPWWRIPSFSNQIRWRISERICRSDRNRPLLFDHTASRRPDRTGRFRRINGEGPRFTVGAANCGRRSLFRQPDVDDFGAACAGFGRFAAAFPAIRIDGEFIGTAACFPHADEIVFDDFPRAMR